jgi:plasmid stability protein
MATLTIKNLPEDIYAALGSLAKRHRRSINGEAIVQLEKALENSDSNNERRLERIRRLRDSLPDVWLTDEDLDFAKNEGRP